MQAARWYGAGDLRVEEIAVPRAPAQGEVLLHISYGGLCGTDVHHVFHPTRKLRRSGPIVLGHEVVGKIVARGAGVTHLHVGQRVVPGAGWWCGTCSACQAGRTNICQHYFLYGIQENGGLAEYATFPAKMCIPVPDTCPDAVAVLAQPLSIALHALSRASIQPTETVAIWGVGAIGSLILAAHVAQQHLAPVIAAIDIDSEKLTRARSLGATSQINAQTTDPVRALRLLTDGEGVDVAIDATGSVHSVKAALSALRKGGKLLLIGIPSEEIPLPLGAAVIEEKVIITSNGMVCQEDLPRALALLATTDLASHLPVQVIPLADLMEKGIIPLAAHQAPGKILVTLPSEQERQRLFLPALGMNKEGVQ